MSVIADFAVPPEDFVLSHAVRNGPDVTVGVERVVQTESSLTPYFRVAGDALDAFERYVDDDETVTNVRTLERVDDERFYRGDWTGDVDHLVRGIREAEATVTHARTDGEAWDLRMVFPTRDALSAFDDHCDEEYDYSLKQVFDRSNTATFGDFEVTAEQRNTLLTALETGYFEVPRDATMEDLADEFGITVQSVSQCMRRGHANLLQNTLALETTESDDAD